MEERDQGEGKKIKSVREFLTKTGFILEMEVAEILRNLGYQVAPNRYFFDYETDKRREIDIIATKKIGEIVLILVIECKQSLIDDWIFIKSDKKPGRYYQHIKHLPSLFNIKQSKIFDKLMDNNLLIPLAQNYIIKDIHNKKSNSPQIENCLEKLPKALVDVAYKSDGKMREILLPVVIFNGSIFVAEHNKLLKVFAAERVQYEVILDSENYTYHYQPDTLLKALSPTIIKKEDRGNSPIAETCRDLGSRYLIDFVTTDGIRNFIRKNERLVRLVDVEKWPLE